MIKINEATLRKIIRESILTICEYAGLDDVVDNGELSRAAIKNGFKLIGYHNTNVPDLNKYGFYKRTAGIHFGSLKAAEERGEERDFGDTNWTHKYFLKSVNPLVIEHDFDWERESFDEWGYPDDDAYFEDIDLDQYFMKTLGWEIMVRDGNGNVLYVKDYADILSEHGYDSIIYKNEKEDAGNYSIALFNPNNIKLAQQTYDDNGNPIPIEQRFNTKTSDVRY